MSMRILDSVYLKAGLISLILVMPFTSIGGGGNPTLGPITFDPNQPSPNCSTASGPNGSHTRIVQQFSVQQNEFAVLFSISSNIAGSGTIPVVQNPGSPQLVFSRLFQSFSGIGNFEVWTAFASTNSSLGSTLDYNESATACVIIGLYLNVAKVGATNLVKGTSDLFNQTITTTTSGSWIIGGTGVAANPQAPQLKAAGSGLLQRVRANSVLQHFVGDDLEDVNTTQLANGYPFFYQSAENNLSPFNVPYSQATLELAPTLPEPKVSCISPQATVASPCTPQCTGNDPFITQCGSQGMSIPIGATTGLSTINLSPAFPGAYNIQTTLLCGVTCNIQKNLPGASVTFLSVESTGQTWAPIPSAKTEIFGDTTHEVVESFNPPPWGGATSASFSVDCSSGLFLTNETFRPEWFNPFLNTWYPVSATGKSLDWSFPIEGQCPSPMTNFGVYGAVNSTISTLVGVLFRVVGFGGDDLVTSVTVQQITLQFYSTITYRPACSVKSQSVGSFVLEADVLFPVVQNPLGLACMWTARK